MKRADCREPTAERATSTAGLSGRFGLDRMPIDGGERFADPSPGLLDCFGAAAFIAVPGALIVHAAVGICFGAIVLLSFLWRRATSARALIVFPDRCILEYRDGDCVCRFDDIFGAELKDVGGDDDVFWVVRWRGGDGRRHEFSKDALRGTAEALVRRMQEPKVVPGTDPDAVAWLLA
jgi:hypothetical protein